MPDGMTIALPSRERVENAIEALVALLDEIDAPTEDREPCQWTNGEAAAGLYLVQDGDDEDSDPAEDEHDQEGIVDEIAPDCQSASNLDPLSASNNDPPTAQGFAPVA